MIEFTEDTRVHSIWFVGGGSFDWLGCVLRQPGRDWKATYRFRYYADDKAHDSADTKRWYTVSPEGDASDASTAQRELATALKVVAHLVAQRGDAEVHQLLVRGSGLDALEALRREGWAHFRHR